MLFNMLCSEDKYQKLKPFFFLFSRKLFKFTLKLQVQNFFSILYVNRDESQNMLWGVLFQGVVFSFNSCTDLNIAQISVVFDGCIVFLTETFYIKLFSLTYFVILHHSLYLNIIFLLKLLKHFDFRSLYSMKIKLLIYNFSLMF